MAPVISRNQNDSGRRGVLAWKARQIRVDVLKRTSLDGRRSCLHYSVRQMSASAL